jgi:glycosyltransferase involved in cell wall biosynthesis
MSGQPRFTMRLGVIGAPAHWTGPDGRSCAYEPYVREMRVWADLFAHVLVCGHAGEGEMKGNLAPYERENIEFRAVRYTRDYGFSGMRRRLVQMPGLIRSVHRTIRESDFILMRSPSHFGLVGATLVRAMRRKSITKWAGENARYKGERIPSRMNRVLEGLPGDLHVTLVYGEPRTPNQISFLPALMSVDELALAREIAQKRTWESPWRIMCVGRLERSKNFDLALRALGELRHRRPDLQWTFTLIGDGTEQRALKVLAAQCEIADRVTFTGALSFREVQEQYGRAHIAIMPGVNEGWPKVIAEAWAHGAFPVASRAGLVPWILKDGESGTVVDASPGALAEGLADALSAPERLQALSGKLFAHAAELSLDQFKHRLERVLVERCGLP